MFSRRPLLLILLLALALPGCSIRLDEEVKQAPINVNPSGCLSNSAPLVERYFDGQAEADEVQAFFACVDKALVTFSEHTEGAVAEQFSGPELSGFLSKYFLNSKVIDPSLVEEFMLLKQGTLGGQSASISREELRKLREIFRVAGGVALRLRRHMPIRIGTFTDRNYGAAEFEAAVADFEKGVAEIGRAVERNQSPYPFLRLQAFLTELKKFLYPEPIPRESWVDTALRWTAVMPHAKSIFIAPPREEIRAADWAKIYELAPRYYGLFLRAHFYFRAPLESYTSGEGLLRLEHLFSDATELLELAVDKHPGGAIPSTEIDALVDTLASAGLLEKETIEGQNRLSADIAKAFVRTLFSRLFPGQSANTYAVTRANTDRLRNAFRFGTEGLRAIEAAFKAENAKLSLHPDQISRVPDETLLAATALKNDTSREAIQALKRSLQEVRTIFPRESGVVYIPELGPLSRVSQPHAAKVHLLYTLNRLLQKAYGSKEGKLTEAEVGVLADDVFPLLTGLGLVAKTSRASVPKRLFEASLFLYSSDGDATIEMTEALELESLLVSTLLRGAKLHDGMAKACDAKERDERGKLLIPADCFRRTFLEHYETTWAYIPGLAKFFKGQSKQERERLYTLMENFLRKERRGLDYNTSDTYSFILLPYYVELLFSRFDADRNGLLDNKESEKAYPVFRPFLAKKAGEHGLDSEADHHALFLFLLGYQALPTDMKVTWLWRRYITGAKDFKVNRGQVIQIFEKLMTQ